MSETWLEQLIRTRSELESPLSFWFWAGLISISAVVKDNIWIDRQIYKLYPNIYVMLHAESGLKKGPPIALANRLVSKVNNIEVIKGRSSVQGILKQMGTGQTAPGGKIKTSSAVFICSSELTSSLVGDKVATDILTDLYDRHYNVDQWKSLLKMETFELKNPTVIMFTATNEAHSNDFFASKDIQGGYFARTFIIHESMANRDNSLLLPLDNPPDDNKAIEYLKRLADLKGPFIPLASIIETDNHKIEWTDPYGKKGYYTEAGLLYEKWYYDFKDSVRAQVLKDDTGTLNRFGDSVLKVAMLLSLARDDSMIIRESDMERAILECEKLVGNVRKTTLGSRGLSPSAAFKTQIIHELMGRQNQPISRPILMKKMWMHYSKMEEFDEMLISFEQAGILDMVTIGNQVTYKMGDAEYQRWIKFFSGKISKEK